MFGANSNDSAPPSKISIDWIMRIQVFHPSIQGNDQSITAPILDENYMMNSSFSSSRQNTKDISNGIYYNSMQFSNTLIPLLDLSYYLVSVS